MKPDEKKKDTQGTSSGPNTSQSPDQQTSPSSQDGDAQSTQEASPAVDEEPVWPDGVIQFTEAAADVHIVEIPAESTEDDPGRDVKKKTKNK